MMEHIADSRADLQIATKAMRIKCMEGAQGGTPWGWGSRGQPIPCAECRGSAFAPRKLEEFA
jgi:hypothetical protein